MFVHACDIGGELYATGLRLAMNRLANTRESALCLGIADDRIEPMAKKGTYIYEWPRPTVTTDAAVFSLSRGKAWLLLVNRKHDPYQGYWAIPGGFIEMDEELEDAAARELHEETGLANVHLEQMRTYGTVGRDPRGRQITVVFLGVIEGDPPTVTGGDDAAEARWFEIDHLPENMAFDHDVVARFAIDKLKRKKIYREAVSREQS
jgi:8-oxo-dGTP diphosphatase